MSATRDTAPARPAAAAAPRTAGTRLLRLAPLALVVACGEPRTSQLTLVHDSMPGTTGVEVIAVPIDPAPLADSAARALRPAPVREPLDSAAADSIARWSALADSAASLDRRFAAERDAINAEVLAMEGADRRSAGYGRRFDAVQRRIAAAESLRAARDRLRRAADAVRPSAAPAPTPAAAIDDAVRRALTDARAGDRETVVVRSSGIGATLRLRPGAWWIGVAPANAAPAAFTRVEVAPTARDTVRLTTPAPAAP